MPKNSRFRTPLEGKQVYGLQSLLKSARQHFYSNFQLSQNKLSYKTSVLVGYEIRGLFGNRLTAALMYSLHNLAKFPTHVETPLFQKP